MSRLRYATERLDRLNNINISTDYDDLQFVQFWNDDANDNNIGTYGNWRKHTIDSVRECLDETPKQLAYIYYIPPYTTGSDYSGSFMEMTNQKFLMEKITPEFLDLEDQSVVARVAITGGHGTYGIGINMLWLLSAYPNADFDSDDALEIIELIEDLEHYPCMDDDLYSHLQAEAEEEAIKSWVIADLRRELHKRLEDEDTASILPHAIRVEPRDLWIYKSDFSRTINPESFIHPYPEDLDDALDDDDIIRRLLNITLLDGSIMFEDENTSMWIDVQKVADQIVLVAQELNTYRANESN